jgi:predicted TIM-barrel fold metal-dependent hydrolase
VSALLEQARRGETLIDSGLVDIHAHLGVGHFALPEHAAAGMVAAMDRVGVDVTMCAALGCFQGGPKAGNDEVASAIAVFPGRIEGYVVAWPTSAEAVEQEMLTRVAQGFKGLKLHSGNGFPYTDEAYAPAWRVADRHHMPVLLHTWGEEEVFDQVRELAESYPRTAILLGHAGCVNLDGYISLAATVPNVWMELCLSRAPRGMVERLVDAVGVDRVVWGTDAVFLSMTQQLGKVIGARLSEEDKLKILGGNSRRLLGRVKPG